MVDSDRNGTEGSVPPAQFPVRQGNNVTLWSYETLYDFGHGLLLRGKYETARSVFERLATTDGRGPRAHIFLALCHVMLGDYSRSTATLHRALNRENYGDVASRLHDVFVLWKVGLFLDVKTELMSLAGSHPELPSLCLLLGDLLKSCGAERLSRQFYRRAIQLDRPGGAVSRSATSVLSHNRSAAHGEQNN